MPDPHGAGEDEQREQGVEDEAGEVGRDHHPLTRQPVGPDAADEQEGDEWNGRGGEHQPEIGGAAGQLHDEQGEGDEHDAVADHARGL